MGPAAGAAIGAGAGIIGNMISTGMQNNATKGFMGIQQQNQMALNNQAAQLARDNWDYTNYENQRKHMEAAGLNVGLMYGMGGGGGSTAQTGSGGSAAMGQAANPNLGMAILQGAQTESQIELNKANARNLNADADNKEKLLGGNIKNLELRNDIAKWEADMKATEQGWKPMVMAREYEILEANLKSAKARGEIDEQTMQTEIDKANLGLTEMATKIEYQKAGINETNENIKLIASRINEIYKKLELEGRSVTAEELKAEAMKQMSDFGSGTGAEIERGSRVIGNVVDGIMSVRKPRMRTTETTEKGYNDKRGDWQKTTTTKTR